MNNTFFPIVFRQKYIKRWGLMRNITSESLSEHAYEVAVIAHALAVIGNEKFGKNYNTDRVVTLALFHDVQEVFTGDLPTPVKYFNQEMRANYAVIEDNSSKLILSKLPEELQKTYEELICPETDDLYKIVKIADKLCAYIKCIEEEKGGNHEFRSAEKSIKKALLSYDSAELKYFMDTFLPTFSLTLDEM